MVIRTQGFQRQSDGKYCFLGSSGAGGEVGVPRHIFLALGLVEACAGTPESPFSKGTGEGADAMAPARA